MNVEGVGTGHLAQRKTEDFSAAAQDAALETELLIGGKSTDDGVVLFHNTAVKPVGILLGPDIQHVQTAGDQLARKGQKVPVVFGLKAVAMVFLAVQSLPGIGGKLLSRINIIGVISSLFKGEAAGIERIQLAHMLFGNTQHHEGDSLFRAEGAQGVNGGDQRTGADRKDKGGFAIIVKPGHHPVFETADQLPVSLIPNVHVAKVIVGTRAVFRHDDGVNPCLVTQRDGFEGQRTHKLFVPGSARYSFRISRRSINASGRRDGSRSRAEG